MSRCSCKTQMPARPITPGLGLGMGMGYGTGSCCCSLPMLVVLILIVLQFSRRRRGFGHDDCDRDDGGLGGDGIVGNGILFIIALFFLSCCNPCRSTGFGY